MTKVYNVVLAFLVAVCIGNCGYRIYKVYKAMYPNKLTRLK